MGRAAASRPGGRTARNTQLIREAVLDLIASEGLSFTFQDVADRSGVSRRTLHRRWPDRDALIADAVTYSYQQLQVEMTGDLVTDLRRFAHAFRDFAQGPQEIAMNGLAALSPDRAFADLIARSWPGTATRLVEMIAEASRDVQPPVSPRVVLMMLLSPITVSCSILREPPTDAEVDALLDHVLRSAGLLPTALAAEG